MTVSRPITCPRCGDSWGADDWRYEDDIHSVPLGFGNPEVERLAASFSITHAAVTMPVSAEMMADRPNFCLHRLGSHNRVNWPAQAEWLRQHSTVRARLSRRWLTFRRALAERIKPEGWDDPVDFDDD